MINESERCYTAAEVGNMISTVEWHYGDEWGPNGITALEDMLGIDHFGDEVAEWARTDHSPQGYISISELLKKMIEIKQQDLDVKSLVKILTTWILTNQDNTVVIMR